MRGPYLSQKYHVLTKLKMARSGQGWRRLKILLILLSAKIRSRGSSRQTFGATELGSPIISTSRSLMSIANMVPACQESGLAPCFFLSSFTGASFCLSFFFFPPPDPSQCFSFFLFFSSPPRKVLLSIWALLGQILERLWEQSLKRFQAVCLFCYYYHFFFYCFCNSFFIQACLSSSLYAVIPLYINKNRYCFISHVLSLYF